MNADAAVETARALSDALGSTPLLSVASELDFGANGASPGAEGASLAERVAEVVDAPVAAGLHSVAARNLGEEAPDEDALVCGDDQRAKELALELASHGSSPAVPWTRAHCGRARSRRPDRGDRQPEPRLQVPRGYPHHQPPVIEIHPVEGLPEIGEGDDLAALIAARAELHDGDVLVVAQKVVSKAEGRVVALADVEPSDEARELAGDGDPRRVEVILRESARLVRTRPPLVIAETRHGFVCASAGVDSSNAPAAEMLVLLPEDPDASAARLRDRLRELTGAEVGVIVSDSFGRAWRQGTTDVAIGLSGIRPLLDLHGERDGVGYELHATVIAVADELAGAAQLVMGKTAGIPAAVIRGVDASGEGTARDLVMPADRDLFR